MCRKAENRANSRPDENAKTRRNKGKRASGSLGNPVSHLAKHGGYGHVGLNAKVLKERNWSVVVHDKDF